MLEELVKQALVGTGRAPEKVTFTGQLGQAIGSLPAGSPETMLLQTAALCSAYQRCGQKPTTAALEANLASADHLAESSPRAGQIVDQLLAAPDSQISQHLIVEWFQHASASNQRVPHWLLPRVLDYAAGHKRWRSVIIPTIDVRGEWLMKLNSRWQFAMTADADVDQIWQTGNQDQRRTAIRQLRETDSTRARSLIESTWDQDAAEERVDFIESLAIGLGPTDEPILEKVLDDKSKRVRLAAAELLTALPQSAFVRRMTERAIPLLNFVPPVAGQILKLKRAKPATIDVTLPPEQFDKALVKDGIVEKPTENMGIRQWWLLQIISFVPPLTWTMRWNLTPEQCIEALGEFGDVVFRGWQLAAKRCSDQAWLRTLTLAAVKENIEKLDLSVLNILHRTDQLEVLTLIAESPRTELDALVRILDASKCELDRRATLAVIDKIEYQLSLKAAAYQYHLAQLLQNLALRVPPQMHDELTTRWADQKWEANRKALDQFFELLVLRRDMKREFSTHER